MSVPVEARTVVAEYEPVDGLWLVMWPDGSVELQSTPEDVLALVRRQDERRSKKADVIVVTRLDWQNTPAGFVPPGTTPGTTSGSQSG